MFPATIEGGSPPVTPPPKNLTLYSGPPLAAAFIGGHAPTPTVAHICLKLKMNFNNNNNKIKHTVCGKVCDGVGTRPDMLAQTSVIPACRR